MFEDLCSNPKISEFLHLYPRSDWQDCVSSILSIGISAIEFSFKRFLPLEELSYLAESTPLPLNFQVPELRNTIMGMKETIDKINMSIEKENNECKKTSRKSQSKRTHKLKRTIPHPILIESTPRFKMLDDMFNKQKWKKETMQTIREESSKSPMLSRASPKPNTTQKMSPGNKRNGKQLQSSENIEKNEKFVRESTKTDMKKVKLPQEGNFTERNYTASPTLEELLSNSRFTVRDEVKVQRNEDFSAISESKHSFEASIQKKQDSIRKNSSCEQRKCALSIAEGFLKNPMISQLAPKEPMRKFGKHSAENAEDEMNSKLSIRSYSPINSVMLLERDDL